MFCPVCGNEENEPMIVNGAKVCHKCGCVIEKAAPVAKPRNPHTPVLVLSIISIPFLLFFLFTFLMGNASVSSTMFLNLLIEIMWYVSYLLSAVYLIISKNKNQNISYCRIIGVLFILLSLIFVSSAIYSFTQNIARWWSLIVIFVYSFLHGVCLIHSNHNTSFEKLSIVLLIVYDIINAFYYSDGKLKFEPGIIPFGLLMVCPFVLIHIAFILHFKQSENISEN